MRENSGPGYRLLDGNEVKKPRVAEDHYRQYWFENSENESGFMDVFSVFPGVELIYNDFSMANCSAQIEVHSRILEIDYCYEGREECDWTCGEHLYLGQGDLCITRMETRKKELYFPTGRYRGITVAIDIPLLEKYPLPLLDRDLVGLTHFADKFCQQGQYFAMRANPQIAHIFSELYRIPQASRSMYFRIKVLELLLFLDIVDPERERRIDRITKGQIEIVKEVRDRLCEDLRQNVTIPQLAREFGISATALKTNFKMVYHVSVKSYLRGIRMERVAQQLRQSNETIAQIAEQVGYANQSKFAAAFKAAYGLSPMEYRKKCAPGT